MANLQYRITDDVLLSINLTDSDRVDFQAATFAKQWLVAADIDKTVWSAGAFGQRLNKTAGTPELIALGDASLPTDNERIYSGNMLVRQGFSWDNVFAILLVVKGMETGNVLISRVWQVSDMLITEDTDIQLIDGAFFPYSVPFTMPNMSNETLMASVAYVTYNDIVADGSEAGFISNYPSSAQYFEPLNSSAPLPDYIVCDITFDNNQYVVVTPATLETNKTLQQSILDYFNFSANVTPIQIDYLIRYGNEAIGYKNIKVSNEDNAFEAIKLGFDFTAWAGSGLVTVYVVMEITCNNVLLTRQQNVIFDLQDNVAPFLNAMVSDQEITVYPVTVVNQSTVNNTVIETVESVKIVPILQPVYVELQSQDIAFEAKNVSFPQVVTASLLQIAASDISPQQFAPSQLTVDGKVYFDLTLLVAPADNTPYTVIDSATRLIITKGNVTIAN
jgi:hypothetical protein